MKRILDKIDEVILDELSQNGRLFHNDIALKVNLSRNAVRLRVERLERDGYIKGYTIVRGRQNPDDEPIRALIFVYRKDRMKGADVINSLSSIHEIISCSVMSGDIDIVLHVEAMSPDRVYKIWDYISGLPGVENTVTSFVLSRLK